MLFSINSNERMRIDSSGDVHLGQSNPGMKLDVNGNVVVGNAYKLYVGAVAVCDNTGCSSPSDRRYKENITPLESSLEKILKLQGVGYDWIDKSAFNERHQIGFIAQDLEKVFPEVVKTDAKTGFKTVVYDHLTAPIVEALKILTRKLSQKPDRVEVTAAVNELKLENAKLKKDNELIKSYLCSKDPASSLCECDPSVRLRSKPAANWKLSRRPSVRYCRIGTPIDLHLRLSTAQRTPKPVSFIT
ncbi:MAG: tail fiber domain-containing protein [Proteobacteria bacterium]|nr:MAG: tail fiber domain-containing protein [Pseudomonadota bacterium]